MFGHGSYGYFVLNAERELIGMIRILSDDYSVSWVAEIAVSPAWQRRGIGHQLLRIAANRFRHTAFYCNIFPRYQGLAEKASLKIKKDVFVSSKKATLPNMDKYLH